MSYAHAMICRHALLGLGACCRLAEVQDKPSSLFTPTAPKPKRQKDKSGGMQQKLEDELVRPSVCLHCGLHALCMQPMLASTSQALHLGLSTSASQSSGSS